jgi:hypothetical protein
MLTCGVDVANIAPRAYDQDVYEILNHRSLESSPILQKATVIFQTRLSNSTPLQDAALELLKTCKAADDLSTPQKSADVVKDSAKSTYAIKAALISLASAGVPGPSACKGFGTQPERFAFQNVVYGNRGADSQPSVNEHTRCVRELFDMDNSWTSYSNALQDANTLCQVPTLENAQRAILDMLSDMNEIVPAWLQTFDEAQKSHLEFMRQQKATAADLSELQRRQREDLEDTHEAAKSALDTMMAATHSHVDGMTGDLRRELVSANLDVEQMKMVGLLAIGS